MKKTRSHFHLSMETTSNGFFNEDSMVNSFGSTIFTGFTKSFSHMHSFPFSFNTSSILHPFSFGALLNRRSTLNIFSNTLIPIFDSYI